MATTEQRVTVSRATVREFAELPLKSMSMVIVALRKLGFTEAAADLTRAKEQWARVAMHHGERNG